MSHTSSRIATGVALASALGICAAAATTRTASADIISTVGLTQVTAPTLVTGDFLANSVTHQIIFAEKKGVTLANDLVTDTGTIAAGTAVDSYFFAVNVLQANPVIVNTSVTFDVPVLGIIYQEFAIDDSGSISLLTVACEAHQRMREAREEVADHGGTTFKDRFGQLRQHPAVAIERDARNDY